MDVGYGKVVFGLWVDGMLCKLVGLGLDFDGVMYHQCMWVGMGNIFVYAGWVEKYIYVGNVDIGNLGLSGHRGLWVWAGYSYVDGDE